ncbi:hypothetical protein [Streptomyces cucumeris]|uniref:hypothetical protein n=1 Tax=Streptomyces cucumeris TaxID=2962890 RepID=UPI003D754BC6
MNAARAARAALGERLAARFADRRLAEQRALLAEVRDELGGEDAVRRRDIRPPR